MTLRHRKEKKLLTSYLEGASHVCFIESIPRSRALLGLSFEGCNKQLTKNHETHPDRIRDITSELQHYICLLICFRISRGRLLHSVAFSRPIRLMTQSKRCGKTRMRDSFNAVNTARAKSAVPSAFSTSG